MVVLYGGGGIAAAVALWVLSKLLGCCFGAKKQERTGGSSSTSRRRASTSDNDSDDTEARAAESEKVSRGDGPYVEPARHRSSEAHGTAAPRPFDMGQKATKRHVGANRGAGGY